MKRIFATALIAGIAVTAALAPALAGPGGGHGHGMMHGMDLNGDGRISTAEAEAMRQVQFLRWDVDGDGLITEQEMLERHRARMEQRIAKRFAMLDANGDGRIERAEFEEHGAARFAAMDTDGDGAVAADEMRRGMHHRGPGGRAGCRRGE